MKTNRRHKGEDFEAENFDAGHDKFQLRIKKGLFLRGDEHAETANEFVAVDFNTVQSVIEDHLMTKQVCCLQGQSSDEDVSDTQWRSRVKVRCFLLLLRDQSQAQNIATSRSVN